MVFLAAFAAPLIVLVAIETLGLSEWWYLVAALSYTAVLLGAYLWSEYVRPLGAYRGEGLGPRV